jgi:NADH pyrophosphatase NudC (nudix superfamily)
MNLNDWRLKWQPTTRGGFEVVDVREYPDSLDSVTWRPETGLAVHELTLKGCVNKGPRKYDLLPVEQPATRTDTEGRDVTGLYGLHDESDRVDETSDERIDNPRDVFRASDTIASLTAERDGLRDEIATLKQQVAKGASPSPLRSTSRQCSECGRKLVDYEDGVCENCQNDDH